MLAPPLSPPSPAESLSPSRQGDQLEEKEEEEKKKTALAIQRQLCDVTNRPHAFRGRGRGANTDTDADTDADAPNTFPTSPLKCSFAIVYTPPTDIITAGHSLTTSEFAHGRFSRVYRAIPAPPSPPATPRTPRAPPPGTLLAVKKPATGSRIEVEALEWEALILSHIASVKDERSRDEHVAKFYGVEQGRNARAGAKPAELPGLVMAAVDLTLEDYIDTSQVTQKSQSVTRDEPVVGLRPWLHLARSLVSGLHWLHARTGVVHGDIKPQNILIRPRLRTLALAPDAASDPFPYDALFADFGSAYHPSCSTTQLVDGAGTATATTFSVGTPAFAAPELLRLRAPAHELLPTSASDVFSLAATLVTAVTGDTGLYAVAGDGGASSVAVYHLAQNGHLVLENVGNEHPWRLRRGSVAVRVLRGAVCRVPGERVATWEWAEVIRGEIEKIGGEVGEKV